MISRAAQLTRNCTILFIKQTCEWTLARHSTRAIVRFCLLNKSVNELSRVTAHAQLYDSVY